MRRPLVTVFALLLLLSAPSFAGPIGYSVQGDGTESLYRVDLGTGVVTRIGTYDLGDIEGLAFHHGTGELWGIRDRSSSPDRLVKIDISTGAYTNVAYVGTAGQFRDQGFAIDYLGNAYMAEAEGADELYKINLTTGAATLVGELGVGGIDGLAFIGTTLYGMVSDSSGDMTDRLYRIDTSNAAVTAIGSSIGTTFEDDAGLASDGIHIYGIDDNSAGEGGGRIVRIDPSTGAGTLIEWAHLSNGTLQGGFEDLAIMPVPLPPAGLAGLGLLGLLAVLRRRRRHA